MNKEQKVALIIGGRQIGRGAAIARLLEQKGVAVVADDAPH